MSGGGRKPPVLAALKVLDIDSGYGFWVTEVDEIDPRDMWRYTVHTFTNGYDRVNVYALKRMEVKEEAAKFIANKHRSKPFKTRFYKGCKAKYVHEIQWDEPILVDLEMY